MRWLVVILTVGLAALIVVSFVSPEATLAGAGVDWFPREVGRGSEVVDRLFDEIEWLAAALLVLTFAVLAWVVWRGAARTSSEGSGGAGSTPLELVWTIVPALILGFLTWSQVGARAEIVAATSDAPGDAPGLVVDVEGAQFDWRFGYAGPDGAFGTLDDVVEVVELTVPIGRNVELRMRSVDVIHSFFVPALRLKRDVVPGTITPLRFQIDEEDYEAAGRPETLELRCSELCGWGHYAMVGRVRPLEPEAFDAWLAEREAARFAGAEPPIEFESGGEFESDEEDER